MGHIIHEVSGAGKDLGFCVSGDIVKYTGVSTKVVATPGDFFVVVGFIDNRIELGQVSLHDLYTRGMDARDNVTDNLIVTLSVDKAYWNQKYWSEYVFIS